MSDTEESPAKKMKLSKESGGLPAGVKPLSTQVAGHATTGENAAKKGVQGFYECEDGTILKALHPDPDPRGPREVGFYEKVFDSECKDPILLELRELVPKYEAVVPIPGENDKIVKYLQLEDIAGKFNKPCVIDIKIGKITYDPDASEEKKEKERTKYPPLEKIGFLLRGFRVYSASKGEHESYSKHYANKLDENTVLPKGLKVFFSLDEKLQTDVVSTCLDKLRTIQKWFEKQEQFAFFASSVLIVYEGLPDDAAKEENSQNGSKTEASGNNEEGESKSKSPVEVRMIDFAHVFPGTGKDENYKYGLDSLIKYLEQLTNEEK